MPKKAPTKSLIPIERVEHKIYLLREEKVMLDSDLAEAAESLRSQIATLKTGRGQHRKYRPYAFTDGTPSVTSPSTNGLLTPVGKTEAVTLHPTKEEVPDDP